MTTPVPATPDDEVTADVRASRRVAAATRRLARALVTERPPVEVLEAVAGDLEALAGRIEGHPDPGAAADGVEFGPRLDPDRIERHPFLGASNPLAPPVVLEPADEAEPETVVASVVLDVRHQGGHGHAHGGWVAALFDQVLAVAGARVAGRPTMTGTLTVRYLEPTPIGYPLRLTATASRAGDRTWRASGTLRADTTATATGEAVLVAARATPCDVGPVAP